MVGCSAAEQQWRDRTRGAADQPVEHQSATNHSMVERLAAKLRQDGSDVKGWVRLVRSHMVIGDVDKTHAATADAQQCLAGDRHKLEKPSEGPKFLRCGGGRSS